MGLSFFKIGVLSMLPANVAAPSQKLPIDKNTLVLYHIKVLKWIISKYKLIRGEVNRERDI